MTFAGLGDPQDRADVIAFLNTHSDAPKPLPAAPAETKPGADVPANSNPPGTGPNNGPQKAENEPVLNTALAGKTPQTSGGDGSGLASNKPKP
jgi:cytochrome c